MNQVQSRGRWRVDFHGKDLAIGFAACGLDLLAFWDPDATTSPWLIVVSAVAAYCALGWQRSRSKIVYAILFSYGLMAAFAFDSYRPTLGPLVALFAVSAYASRRSSYAALTGTLIIYAFWIADEARQGDPDRTVTIIVVGAVLYALLAFSAFSAGQWQRVQRQFVLESLRREEAEAANAINSERARIASELHDIVAHGVTVIILQAAAARCSMDTDRQLVERALANIELSGQQAMIELRRLLSIVRPDADTQSAPEVDAMQQLPGVANIGELLTIMRSVGLRIEFTESGDPAPLDQVVDLAAYRIVQEALTNVAKHAGPTARVTISLAWDISKLRIVVGNDITARSHQTLSALSTGQGLAHLRERVRVAQGSLRIDASGHMFSVLVCLPIIRDSSQPRMTKAQEPEAGQVQTAPHGPG